MSWAAWAADLACALLEEPLPQRWAHTQSVAAQAEHINTILATPEDADMLTAAAWLHDIGYALPLVVTGFHPLDGARYLRDTRRADARLCRLVAHHSCSIFEAEERGLAQELSTEFPSEPDPLTDPLTYCDMTTGPDGRAMSVERRITDIYARYGAQHVVARSITQAVPEIRRAVRRIQGNRVQIK